MRPARHPSPHRAVADGPATPRTCRRGAVVVAAAVALFVARAAPAAAEAPTPPRAFVEVVVRPSRPFVEQPVDVVLRVGVESRRFADAAVPMSGRALSLPVHAGGVDLARLDGLVAVPSRGGASPEGASTLAWGDDVVAATRVGAERRDETTYDVYEVVRRVLFERAGPVAFPAPTLRYAWGARFDEDLLDGRVAVDVRAERVVGSASTVDVAPLPDEGRPASFSGIVGRYAVTASLDRDAIDLGGSARLTVHFVGDGNLDVRAVPALGDLAGFHTFGRLAAPQDGAAATWDVAPTSADVTSVPSMRFAAFDPTPPARYVELVTAPIPLRVRPASGPASAPSPARADGGEDGGGGAVVVALALGFAALAIAVLVARRRRRARHAAEGAVPAAPPPSPREAFARALAANAGDVGGALSVALETAAGLRRESASSLAPVARIEALGLSADLVAALREVVRRCDAARYGADPTSAPSASSVEALLERVAAEVPPQGCGPGSPPQSEHRATTQGL
ncbi:MAG: BatD family protein [Planctomycetes bacterium]|nr:BatD family protein [Planctomycetota bacterium]